jgi:peptide/nickel transport system permease protein
MTTSVEPPKNSLPLLAVEVEAPPLSLGDLTWRRFRRHKMAIFGAVVLFLLAFYSFGCAFFVTEKYSNFTNTKERLQPPSTQHFFGTDTVGRDILARTIYGGQISIMIGLTAAFVEVMVGILIGAVAGYFGGKIDAVLMRFTEAMLNMPQLLLLIVMSKFFSGSVPNINILGRELSGSVIVIIFIIGLTSWPYLARIVRAEFLSIKEREFILAARATGTPNREIIFKHILPNCIAPIVVSATLGVAGAISLEAYVSFLGMGVRAPTATWGNMLENAYRYIESAYWLWFFPGMLIVLITLSINFLGDGLRDALDPRSRTV